MVRYPDEKEDRFIWHSAKIKTIQKKTVTVIWMEGEYRGTETPKIPHSALFLDDAKNDITSLKTDMKEVKEKLDRTLNGSKRAVDLLSSFLEKILVRLDDLNKKMENQANLLLKKDIFAEDLVSYDSSLNRLADSLRGLESSGSVDMQDDVQTFLKKKKYTSYDGNSRY